LIVNQEQIMVRSAWISLLAIAVVGAGSWFYYVHQQTTLNQTITSTTNELSVPPAKPADDDLNKKRQEGIGSIKGLKPVPIAPSSDKSRSD
jgi:hypothetical protein